MAKYQAYAEYKDSGIEWLGEIPSHWEKILFKRVVLQVKDGTHGTHQRVEEGSYLLSAKNVFNHGIEIGLTESRIPNKDYQEIVSNGFPKKGDILVTCVGTIGRSCVYTFEKPIAFQRSVAFLRLNSQCDSKYYKYFIESKQYQSQLESLIKSSAQGGVYMGDLINTVVANCDFLEQKQISNFLDHETTKIDRLIEKQQQLIELLKEKRQAVISHAVTKGLNPNVKMKDSGVEWLGQLPEHWDVIYIKHLTEVKRGASPRPIDDPKYFDDEGEYAWTRIADVTKAGMYLTDTTQKLSKLGSSLSVRLEPNELFLSIAGTVGKPCITVFKACIHDGFVYFPTLKMNNKFLYYIFEAGQAYLGLGKMGTQLNLNTDTVGGIKIGLPPNFEIEQIISYIETQNAKYDFLILTANKQVSLLQERRTALISAAVTGKIDVRHWHAPTVAEAQTELSA